MDLPIEGGSGDVKKPAAAPPTADSSSVASTAANPDQSQDSSTKTSSLLPNISTALSSRTSHDSSRSSFDALSHLPQSPPLRQTDIPVSIQISPKDSNLILIAYQNGLMVLYNLSKRSIVHRFSIIPTEKVKNMLIRSTGKTFEEYTDEGELLLGPLTDACFR